MNKPEVKLQGDGGRFEGTTWQDLLDVEQVEVVVVAPVSEDPQIGGVADPSAARVPGQERRDGDSL